MQILLGYELRRPGDIMGSAITRSRRSTPTLSSPSCAEELTR
jgi:hypothetical protein